MNTEALNRKTSFLFDFDGTLIDSSAAHERAFLDALKKSKPDLAPTFCYEHWKGYRTESVFRHLGVSDEETLKTLTNDKQSLYRSQVELGAVRLIPSAVSLLEYLARKNRRLFIVTSASRSSLDKALDRLHIGHFFEFTISGDDVALAKPAPDSYLKCLSNSGALPADSVVIEDASAGVESAHAAGLDVVVVNNDSLSGIEGYLGSLENLHKLLLAGERV